MNILVTKMDIVQRLVEYRSEGVKSAVENMLLEEALLQWKAPVQGVLKVMGKATSGIKEVLVNRIVGYIPINKLVDVVTEYRTHLVTKIYLAGSDMDVDEDRGDIGNLTEATTLDTVAEGVIE